MKKVILDPCCAARQFWFDKKNPMVQFDDIRKSQDIETGIGINKRTRKIRVDNVGDFTCLKYKNESYKLVVFDPPHLFLGEKSYMAKSYGRLEKHNWKNKIEQGFSECFRVLEYYGILVFKWNETDIPLKNILELTEYSPLFGHPSGKAQKTHWVTFMKHEIYMK